MASPTQRTESFSPQKVLTDDERLAQLGYKAELKRNFSLLSSVGICLAVIAVTPGIGVTLANGLASGGPVSIIYGWILSSIMALCIAATMGEIASAYPLAGALYNYSAQLAPPKYRNVICFFTGWINLVGQLAITAAIDFSCALLILAMAVINTDGAYVPATIHKIAVYWLVLLSHAGINCFGGRTLHYANQADVFCIAFGTIIIIIVLLVKTEHKNDASFVFGGFTNETGWSSDGFAWLLGLLQSCYTLTGFDAAGHLSEETANAATSTPRGMVFSVASAGVVGLVFLIALLFCVGDINTVLASPTGEPVAQIFLDSAGKSGALGLLFLLVVMQYLAGLASVTANSRMCWSFSRDGALPFGHYLKRVNPKSKVPLYAILFCITIQFVLVLVALGAETVFFAFTSVGTIGLYLSYGIPTLLLNTGGRQRFEPGPFSLGRWSAPLGWISVIWVVFTSVLFLFPNFQPVTGNNMNYASAMLGAYFICATAYYLYKRKTFRGPIGNLQEISPEDVVEKELEE
ncbi:amino acid transporter [Ramaria rubella]|nr:amino acid transporter [Ramaria rubella]